MARYFLKLLRRLAWWQKLAAACLAPLLSLNLSVAFFGNTLVSPVSPFFLKEKWHALNAYARHRPGCLLRGHPDVEEVALQAELRHRLPPGLMRAVVQVESRNAPHRISHAGAMGPAQLMPGTAAMLKIRDPFDPAEGVDGGARYLAQLLQRKGDVRLAIASYNAGPGAVLGAVPKNGETEAYVARVMQALSNIRQPFQPRRGTR